MFWDLLPTVSLCWMSFHFDEDTVLAGQWFLGICFQHQGQQTPPSIELKPILIGLLGKAE